MGRSACLRHVTSFAVLSSPFKYAIASSTETLENHLPIALSTSHCSVIHSAPLSIMCLSLIIDTKNVLGERRVANEVITSPISAICIHLKLLIRFEFLLARAKSCFLYRKYGVRHFLYVFQLPVEF